MKMMVWEQSPCLVAAQKSNGHVPRTMKPHLVGCGDRAGKARGNRSSAVGVPSGVLGLHVPLFAVGFAVGFAVVSRLGLRLGSSRGRKQKDMVRGEGPQVKVAQGTTFTCRGELH